MTKPLRLAIVGAVVVGTLVVSLYQTSQRRPSVIREYDWGGMRGSGVANAVGGVDEVDGEPGRFSYYTGARSVDVGPLIAAPTRVLAEAASGSVSLRLLAFDDYGRERARRGARARAHRVGGDDRRLPGQRNPGRDRPAFHARRRAFLPGETRRLARGPPLRSRALRLTRRPPPSSMPHAERCWRMRPCRNSRRRRTKSRSSTNCSATACSNRHSPARSSSRHWTWFGVAPAAPASEGSVRCWLATVLERVFARATAITLDSPQGATLLALCKDAAADPFAIEPWLAARAD